ncbi:hypothetical protein M3Y99_00817400 [Aphelenchoides fujianensis]|nr:hypothetical protein M3Y99_00817400 [Aphelenchoides fujianensis]
MHSGRCKYENGGTTAVSRLELCFHEPHESFDFRLKEDVPVQFRMFFRPEPSKEGEADESELGILISDFDSNDSFDCRIECTIVDGKLRRIHKSVCNNYTFERETKECWSVRLPRQALRDEQKYGRVCVDFRLELKPPGSHEKENEEVAADAEPELSPPTTFQLEVLSKPPGIPAHFVWSIAHAGFVNPKILPPPEQYGPIQPPANGNEWKNGVLPPPPPPPDLLANGTGDHASPVPADPLDNKELHGVFLSLKIRRCSPKKTFPLDIPCLSDVQYLDPPAAFSPQEKKEELPPLVPMEIDEPQPAGAALASPIEDHSKPEVKEGGETVEDGEKPAPQAAEATVPGDVITLTDDEDEAVGCSGGKQDAKLQPIQRAVAETDEPNRTFEHKEAKQNAQLNGHHDSGHSLSHLPPEQMGGRTKSTKMSAVNGTGVKKEDLSFVQPEGTPAFSTADPRIPPSKRSRAAKEEGGMVEEKKPRVIEVVTIEADGEKFKASPIEIFFVYFVLQVDKQRLTAESTFFAQAVAANEGAGAFEVDGIDRPSMVALCEWVERGEVANFEQKACDLFIMAKQLGMPAFQAACIEAIKRGQTDENQAALFVFAVQQDDEELLGALSPWNEETTRKVVELLKCPDMKDVLSARSPFMAEMYAAMYPN